MKKMNFKENWRELSLIVLGILIIAAPWIMFDFLAIITNVVLGVAVIIVGAWPFIQKSKPKSA